MFLLSIILLWPIRAEGEQPERRLMVDVEVVVNDQTLTSELYKECRQQLRRLGDVEIVSYLGDAHNRFSLNILPIEVGERVLGYAISLETTVRPG